MTPDVYDVRNKAGQPYAGSIGDEVYIPPSETGSTCKFNVVFDDMSGR